MTLRKTKMTSNVLINNRLSAR